jgi:YHS domain-containing protein
MGWDILGAEMWAMEYVIKGRQAFEEVEAQAIRALQQEGYVVQRTFSLRSATSSGRDPAAASPGYSVLLLYALGEPKQVLGLVTLYERAGQIVIQPQLAPTGSRDAEAQILAALGQGGLEVCVEATGGGRCAESGYRAGEREGWVHDPVCGRALRPGEALVVLEYRGKRYYACCPHCKTEFERNPERYAPA